MSSRLSLIFNLLWLSAWSISSIAEEKIVYSTWDNMEVDKCASIWLIKRYIAPQAEIHFFKKGEQITEGIEFDTPKALFRRQHNKSTFEALIEQNKLNEEKLIYLSRIIHDIEINIWDKKVMEETAAVENEVGDIIALKDKENVIESCYQYFSNFENK